jgi:tetratricopeptide (TPR) repeat protein/class 3 adenylate cyclase/TolB-like protein
MSPAQGSFDDNQTPTLEMAYVLFMDIVGYSRMATDVQQETLRRLQRSVRSGNEFQRAQEQQRLISLPTGDGMALAFFTDPESCVRCAVETTRALKDQEGIPLRMGMHAGPVFRVADINANQNVAGEGINIAQRVMDCGDAGHILVSKSLGDVLRQLSGWKGALQDLGEVSVKHGVRVHVFNLLVEGAGNRERPGKFLKEKGGAGEDWQQKKVWVKWALPAAVVLVLAGTATWWFLRPATPVFAYRPRIALLGFRDETKSKETEWLGTSLTSHITSQLSAGQKLVTVPDDTVSKAVKELALPEATSYGPETMERVRKDLPCDYIVYGSYYDPGKNAGGTITVNVRMQNTKTGELVAFPMEGTEQGLQELTRQVGQVLRSKLGAPNLSIEEIKTATASVPATLEGKKLYSDGLNQWFSFSPIRAQDSFEKLVKVEPTFPLGHMRLAEALQAQGFDKRAVEEAEKANELAGGLSPEYRGLVEASQKEISSDWKRAAQLYDGLWNLFLEKPEYAYREANAQIRGGKPIEALETVARLRAQPKEMVNSPAIDLREAEAFASMEKWNEASAAAAKTAISAHEIGTSLLEAEALWRSCEALNSLGKAEMATKACGQSVEIAKPLGDGLLIARDLTILGRISSDQGKLAEALALHRQALDQARKAGSRRDIAGALINIGTVLSAQGDHSGAAASYENAVPVAQEINDKQMEVDLMNDMATEFQMSGKLTKSIDLYKKSIEKATEIKNEGAAARAENNMGTVLALEGKFPEAIASIQSAIRRSEAAGLKSDRIGYFYSLGDLEVSQGDLEGAEKNYQTGLRLAKQISDKPNTALGQVSLGSLELLRGQAGDALELGKTAAMEYHVEANVDGESLSRNLTASSFLALGKPEDALKEINLAKVHSSQDPSVSLGLGITEARVEVRLGKRADGKKSLEKAVSAAKQIGDKNLEFEARLGIGEIGLYGGDKRTAIATLQGLAREASQRGFKQFASRAQELNRQIGNL